MDQEFIKNQVGKNQQGFEYDKRVDFDGEESNEWDEGSSVFN